MQDRPTAEELVDAVRGYLEDEVLPDLRDDRRRFRALVAINALRILERELHMEESLLQREAIALSALLGERPHDGGEVASYTRLRERVAGLNLRLARAIREGDVPAGTLAHLRATAADKLRVASPRYLERYST